MDTAQRMCSGLQQTAIFIILCIAALSDILYWTNCLGPKEGYFLPESLSISSSNFTAGPIENITPKSLSLVHFLNCHGYNCPTLL